MLTDNQIIKIFGKDKSRFANVEYYLSKRAQKVYAEEDGVILLLNGIPLSYGFTEDSDKSVFNLISKYDICTCSSELECRSFMAVNRLIQCIKPCFQIRYDRAIGLSAPDGIEVKAVLPTDENIDFITKTYSLGYSRDEIEKLVKTNDFLGAYQQNTLAGYIGRHEEGSIGLLEVMPEFRRRGIGTCLIDRMVYSMLQKGEIVYSHIACTNEKSLAMHRSMGYEPAGDLVYWCTS